MQFDLKRDWSMHYAVCPSVNGFSDFRTAPARLVCSELVLMQPRCTKIAALVTVPGYRGCHSQVMRPDLRCVSWYSACVSDWSVQLLQPLSSPIINTRQLRYVADTLCRQLVHCRLKLTSGSHPEQWFTFCSVFCRHLKTYLLLSDLNSLSGALVSL